MSPSPKRDSILSITDSKFINNKAVLQGGSLQHVALGSVSDTLPLNVDENLRKLLRNYYTSMALSGMLQSEILIHAGTGGAITSTHPLSVNITKTLFHQNQAFLLLEEQYTLNLERGNHKCFLLK